MVNEKQLLEADMSLMRYYEKKFKETDNEYERQRLMYELAMLDIEIYDLRKYLGYSDPGDF